MKFRDMPDQGSGQGGSFLKLKNKESATGVFLGEPYEFFQIWENGKTRVVTEGTPKASFRFRLNFIVKEGNGYVAKIFENGPTVYRDLKAIHQEYNLEDTVVKITRHGEKLETTYTVMPVKGQVTPEVKRVKLLDLEVNQPKPEGFNRSEPESIDTFSSAPMPDNYDEIPF